MLGRCRDAKDQELPRFIDTRIAQFGVRNPRTAQQVEGSVIDLELRLPSSVLIGFQRNLKMSK